MVTLRIEDISFSYPSVQALRDVSIAVQTGSFVGVIGPNGAGKSTFLKCLARILEPQTGIILLDGVNLRRLTANELARLMAVVLTSPIETPQMLVSEVLTTARHPHTGFLGLLSDRDIQAIEEAIGILKVGEFTSRRYSELSDGQRQRVLFARALAQEPRVLLLDEPTVHLDLKSQLEVLESVKNLSKQRDLTVISTFHDITLASLFSDEMILMKDGVVLGAGDPETVLTEDKVTEAYSLDGVVIFDLLGRLVLPTRRGRGKVRVHVVAGGGSGPKVFRELSRFGCYVTSGIIHSSEIDYIAARAACNEVVSVEPHTVIDEEAFQEAKPLIDKADVIIDAGFPLSPLNERNMQLVEYARGIGKKVISLRGSDTQNWPNVLSEYLTAKGD